MSTPTQVPPEQQVPPTSIHQPPIQHVPLTPTGVLPQFQPPQPPKRRRLKWWHWVLIGVGGVIVLAIIGNALGRGSTPTSSSPTVASQPTSAPTSMPTPIPTRDPTSGFVSNAVLGSPETVFLRYYQPVNYVATSTSRSFRGTLNGQQVWIVASLDNLADDRVQGVLVHPISSGVTWNAAEASEVAKSFMPSDANYVRDYQVPDLGVEHVYYSAALAATFPASAFSNQDTGQSVSPGTFWVMYDNSDFPEGACILGLGE